VSEDVSGQIERKQVTQVITLLLCLAIPAILTFRCVDEHGSTALAYTWSLGFFAVPNTALAIFMWRNPGRIENRAFWGTVAIIFVVGAFLDFFLAHEWFEFTNKSAVVGFHLPAFSWKDLEWKKDYLPIEEFGFYFLGAVFMTALYAWGDVTLFSRYQHPNPSSLADAGRIFAIHPRTSWAAVILIVLVAGVLALSQWLRTGEGFAGYFLFLVAIGVLPPFFTLRRVAPMINWQAFLFMYSVLIMLSIIWEATLALQYEWWNYRREHMLGWYIKPWHDLPFEAVMMWLVSGWAAVIMYETFRLAGYSSKPLKSALLG
jgi:hypothetical protein